MLKSGLEQPGFNSKIEPTFPAQRFLQCPFTIFVRLSTVSALSNSVVGHQDHCFSHTRPPSSISLHLESLHDERGPSIFRNVRVTGHVSRAVERRPAECSRKAVFDRWKNEDLPPSRASQRVQRGKVPLLVESRKSLALEPFDKSHQNRKNRAELKADRSVMVNKLRRFFRSLGGKSTPVVDSKKQQQTSNWAASDIPVLGDEDFPIGSGPYGSSSAVGFRPRAATVKSSRPKNEHVFDSYMSTPASASPAKPESSRSGIKWGLVLGKIPKLVADATNASLPPGSQFYGHGSSDNQADNDFPASVSSATISGLYQLRDLLIQTAGSSEFRAEIRTYYFGRPGPDGFTNVPPVGSEQRRVLRRCRHAFIMCWKFLLSQLSDEHMSRRLSSEHKELYFDLIVLIAERVEFNLTTHATSNQPRFKETIKVASPARSLSGQASLNVGWDAPNSWSLPSPTGSAALIQLAGTIAASPGSQKASERSRQPRGLSPGASNNSGYPMNLANLSSSFPLPENAGESPDEHHTLAQYRCLLVATFKMVAENMDAARHRKRSWVPLAESRFFAKMLAICFIRVPAIQELILDDVYEAYCKKCWANSGAHDTRVCTETLDMVGKTDQSENARHSRRRQRRTSVLWDGLTFVGTLSRWGEFRGQKLGGGEQDLDSFSFSKDSYLTNSTASSSSSTGKSNHGKSPAKMAEKPPSQARRSSIRHESDAFKLRNPSLFGWSQFVPYISECQNADVFYLERSVRSSLRRKITRDGEFFAIFMGYLTWHIEVSATILDSRGVAASIVWDAISGYVLLARVSMLLMKEACWAKWLYVRDKSGPLPSSSMELQSPCSSRGSSDGDDDENNRKSDAPFALTSIRSIRTVLDNVAQLLRNSELLDCCVMAMYESTNVLHARSVDVCLVRFEEWLLAAASTPDPLLVASSGVTTVAQPGPNEQLHVPTTFNTQAFGAGIRVMLASENCEILNRALLFVYNRIDLFEGELRQNILKALVQRHMALFLHWNDDVRRNYHHLLVYKVARVSRDMLMSPIDNLLLGKLATAAPTGMDEASSLQFHQGGDAAAGADYADNFNNHRGLSSSPASMNLAARGIRVDSGAISTAQFNQLRMEQALWRAFDACMAVICVNERRNARDAHRRYQNELLAARCRAAAFHNLNQDLADDKEEDDSMGLPSRLSSINEGLPGASGAIREVERLDDELHREPPYYLRYMPAEEVATLDELRRLASAVKYPPERQIYAAPSLRAYSDLLKKHYRELQSLVASDNSVNRSGSGFIMVPAPPLGYY